MSAAEVIAAIIATAITTPFAIVWALAMYVHTKPPGHPGIAWVERLLAKLFGPAP